MKYKCQVHATDGRQCGKPAGWMFRWGSDPCRLCCDECRLLLLAGAERLKRTVFIFAI